MVFGDLVKLTAEKAGKTQKEAEEILQEFVNSVIETLQKGEKIYLKGLGVFEVKERAGRTYRNPQTGENVEVPPTKTVKFKVGKLLKEQVKNS